MRPLRTARRPCARDPGRGRHRHPQWIEGFEVDCVWREQRLAVELDGRSYHDTLQAYERDRERDRLLQAAGWRPVRVTWRQLDEVTRRAGARPAPNA